ncbi:MAG: 4'-phosphopantetheinyl transferase superfamily protein, partial [Rhodobacteraceae bacterium]|nr:4'-phosphopantetheinyl transferase superfamily protein [Paracoccaceae bacterium]
DGEEFTDIPLPAALARAVLKRRNEFRAGRHCARHALRSLGVPATIPLIGPDRAPVWPEGIVGSISHSANHAIAVVASRQTCRGLGIDVEILTGTDDLAALSPHVATRAEMRLLRATYGPAESFALLFSGKEAIYKAIFPQIRRFVDFHEIICVGLAGDRLLFRPCENIAQILGGNDGLSVAFDIRAGRILSLCSLGPMTENL